MWKKKYRKHNVVIATYSVQMFNKIKYAIIKPGFGLIKDCLRNNVLIYSFLNSNFNKEFFNNAKALKINKLGFITKSLHKGYQNITQKKMSNINDKRKHYFNGENDIIKYIETIT